MQALCASTGLICLFFLGPQRTIAREISHPELLQLPVIPDWAGVREDSTRIRPDGTTIPEVASCPPVLAFGLHHDIAAIHYDPAAGVTQIYGGDYWNTNQVIRHDVASNLTYTSTVLPIPYGVPWVAADLDGDGNMELVLQRGDAGFGGNGYLDILSAPSWTLRKRFTFIGGKVYMFAVAVNVDADPDLELFLTPGDFGQSHAVLIDYDRDSANFVIVSDVPMPELTTGQAAIGDFDNDGRMEFIVGGDYGYKLFECDGNTLHYIGRIGDTTAWNNTHAIAARPKPGDTLYALIGHSSGSPDTLGFYYELMKPVGDNAFQRVHLFGAPFNAEGIDPCFASDVDCDGLDEMVMMFVPSEDAVTEEWDWSDVAGDFVRACIWDSLSVGTPVRFHSVDLNQDGIAEWGVVNHLYAFIDIPDSCTGCTSSGRCPFPGPVCNCPCNGDPHCEGQVNILDVVETISVAFRGSSPAYDSMCPRDRTDVDCSGVTDILDVVKTVNVAFRAGNPATEFCKPCQ